MSTNKPSRPKGSARQLLTLGGLVPPGVGVLLLLTIAPSLVAALGARDGGALLRLASLDPAAVWHGQVWRLGSYVLVEPDPFGLLVTCATYGWFGRDLAEDRGSRRFVALAAALALSAAVLTCLVALVDADVAKARYLGAWPLTTALFVAWGLTFPRRVARVVGFVPIPGWWAAWGTVALTVLYAAYGGWQPVFPELAAELAIVSYLTPRPRGGGLAKLGERARRAWDEWRGGGAGGSSAGEDPERGEDGEHGDIESDDDALKRRIDEAVAKSADSAALTQRPRAGPALPLPGRRRQGRT